MSESNENKKVALINHYFDALAKMVDNHAKELLAKFSPDDILPTHENVFSKISIKPNLRTILDCQYHQIKPCDEKTFRDEYNYEKVLSESLDRFVARETRVWSYVNQTRDEMLERINKTRAEALKQYELIRYDREFLYEEKVGSEMEKEQVERMLSKIFAKQFVFLMRINTLRCEENLQNLDNPSIFKLYLIELDFYVDQNQINFLINSLLRDFIFKGFIQVGNRKPVVIMRTRVKSEILDQKLVRLHMLTKYLDGLLRKLPPYVHVFYVPRSELYTLEHFCVDHKYTIIDVNIAHDNKEKELAKNLKSFELYARIRLMPKIACLSGLHNLERLRCYGVEIWKSSFKNLPRIKQINLIKCKYAETDTRYWYFKPSCKSLHTLAIMDGERFNESDLRLLVDLKQLVLNKYYNYYYTYYYTQCLGKVNRNLNKLSLIKYCHEKNEIIELAQNLGRFRQLECLELVAPKLTYFKLEWLRDLANLKCLRIINDGNLESIDLTSINSSGFINLQELDLSNNSLIEINQSDRSFKLLRLEKLNLSRNYLSQVSRGMWRHFVNLKSLDLSFNVIESIEDDCFEDLVELEHLNLAGNWLTQVDHDAVMRRWSSKA